MRPVPAVGLALLAAASAVASPAPSPAASSRSLFPEVPGWRVETVAESRSQWTGVAVSRSGRVFVNYPRWSASLAVSVAELSKEGTATPYPPGWNGWKPGEPVERKLVCVQSVVVDAEDALWLVDTGTNLGEGLLPGASRLLRVDLRRDEVARVYPLAPPVAGPRSYLNDVRVDVARRTAYLTDSGEGAIVVVDLASGKARRLLHGHPSTQAEQTALVVEGRPWLMGGQTPQIHSDGLALSPGGAFLYYQALSGRTLYRIPTEALRDETLGDEALASRVEAVGRTGAADGIEFDRDGFLYLTAPEHDAVHRLTPEGKLQSVARDPLLAWPDSLAWGPGGELYVTTSQIHRGPNPPQPYRLLRLVREGR